VPVPRRFDRQPPERDPTRTNERIRVPEVRLIDETGQQVGIMKTQEALRYAQSRDLDLVEVAPEAKPPVCRVLDYSKYKYEQNQKQKQARKHQTQINVREIKFRPKIAQHDYDTKKGHVERFLKSRDKVKVTIMFRGREMAHPERGELILNRLAEDLGELAVIEQRPQQDGRNMTMLLAPTRTHEDGDHAAAQEDAQREGGSRRKREARAKREQKHGGAAPEEAPADAQPEPPADAAGGNAA
jgi:translation initiation factor IF-3